MPNTGYRDWEPIADNATEHARIRLVCLDDLTIKPETPGTFKIVAPNISIIPPEQDQWYATGTYPIKMNLQ